MTPDSILKDAKSSMDKAVEYLRSEVKGIRTGRASTALVEYIKVDYYGSPTDLKSLASISVPEPTQILIIPPLSGDRRKQLAAQVKKLGEDAKVAVRNVRRDANKHADTLSKDKNAHLSEDQIADLKDKIQDMLKQHESGIDQIVDAKSKEIMEV
jgi:ribosome recycling factor